MGWHAKSTGGYARDSIEAQENATEIYNILKGRGWNDNAIFACLGNLGYEGQYNPWRWESDVVPTVEEYESWTPQQAVYHGYGMWGFTPASKYIESDYAHIVTGYGPNFSDNLGDVADGRAQTYFMETGDSGWIVRSRFNNMTFNQFKTSELPLYNMTEIFLYCFENPANPASTLPSRFNEALYWWSYFSGLPPEPDPDPPDPDPDPPEPVFVNDRRRWPFYLFM